MGKRENAGSQLCIFLVHQNAALCCNGLTILFSLLFLGNRSHLRQTNKKEIPSEDSLLKIQQSTIWKMEHEFYEFALEQFHFQKRLTFRPIIDMDSETVKQKLEIENQQTYMLSDGKFYIAKSMQFHYEKVRPR